MDVLDKTKRSVIERLGGQPPAKPEDAGEIPKTDATENSIATLVILFISGAALVGWIGGNIVDGDETTIGLALFLSSGAAAGLGALLGLLFSLTGDDPSKGTGTQLDKISDWLTKLLIGFGLAQASSIGDAGSNLLDSISSDLEANGFKTVFAGAAVLFGVAGFLASWFHVRLALPGAMARADMQKWMAERVQIEDEQQKKIEDVGFEIDDLSAAEPGSPLAEKKIEYKSRLLDAVPRNDAADSKFEAVVTSGDDVIGLTAQFRALPLTSTAVDRYRDWGRSEQLDKVLIVTNLSPSDEAQESADKAEASPEISFMVKPEDFDPRDITNILE